MHAILQGGCCSSCGLTSNINVSRGCCRSVDANKTRRTRIHPISCRSIGSQGHYGAHSRQHVQETKVTCAAEVVPSDTSSDQICSVADRSSVTSQYLAAQNVRRRACAAALLVTSLLVLQPALPCAAAGRDIGDSSPGSIPEDLRSTDTRGPSLGQLLRGPKTEEVTRCTRKCMPACIRGGEGAPGLGPLTVRKDLVKFKDGFRTRSYCLSECTQVCAASITGIPAAPTSRE